MSTKRGSGSSGTGSSLQRAGNAAIPHGENGPPTLSRDGAPVAGLRPA